MKKALAVVLAIMMLITATACGGAEQPAAAEKEQTESPSEAATPAVSTDEVEAAIEEMHDNIVSYYRGDITVFETETVGITKPNEDGSIVIYSNSITNCDPANTTTEFTWCENVYESLFWKNSVTGEFEPLLATAWEFDDEGNFHVTLRDGVKFHDGNTLDAYDVLYTIERTTQIAKSKANSAMKKVDLENCVVEDDLHLVIKFKEPIASFMNYMASSYMGIVSKEFCEEMGSEFDFMTADAGSGAYKLVETVTGNSQTFEAFDEWWGGAVEVHKVIAKNYKDLTAMFIDFQNGDLDVAFLNNFDSVSRVLSGEATDCVYYNIPNNRGIQLVMTTIGDSTPFSDIRIREALSLCIDYDTLIEGVYGSTDIATVPTSQLIAGNDMGAREYNPEKAAELLGECGYSISNPLKVTVETSNNAYSVAACEMIQAFGEAVGFAIEVNSETSQASAEAQSATKVPADNNLILGNFTYSIDPQDFWFGCDAYDAEVGTYSGAKGVDDQKASELIRELRANTDAGRRAEIVKELEQYYNDMYYFIPVAFTTSATTVQYYLENMQFRSGYTFYWAAATFAD